MPVSESKKQLQATRRAAGQCIQCGEAAEGKTRCPKCAAKAKTSREQSRERCKEEGKCPNCREPSKPGCIMCQACIDKYSVAMMARYEANKAAGVCAYCGKPADGKFSCPDCLAKNKDYQQERYNARKTDRCCTTCNVPLADDDEHVICPKCRHRQCGSAKKRWETLKLDAINAYGGPTCVGCGESEIAILEIDHIDGGGTKHRKEIGLGNMYLWLKQNNYQPGYRVLCPTCNKKAHRGILTLK